MTVSEKDKRPFQKTAWMSAQAILSRREHSKFELYEKLSQKGFESSEIEKVVSELQHRGWQSDERFCEAFVRFRIQKGQGPQKIQFELKKKGVDLQIITSVLQMYDAQWLQLCENVLEKKYGDSGEISFEEKAKRLRFLNSRGFPTDIIRQIL